MLWSLQASGFDYQFARRVQAVKATNERVAFDTREVGLGVVASGVRAADGKPGAVAARLRTLLPERLPPGLRRSFIQTDDDGYGVSYSSLDGRVRLSIMPFGRERLQAIRDHLQGDGSMREETRSGRTLYVKDEDSRATAAVLLDGAYVRLTAHPDAQLLDAALQALDLSAVEALLAEAAE